MALNLTSLPLPLQTRRLALRDYIVADVPSVFAYAKEDAYWQFQRAEAPTAEQLETLLGWVVTEQNVAPRTMYFLAATRRDTGEIIGEAVLKIVDPAERQGEIGFGIAPKFWKMGFATEIAGVPGPLHRRSIHGSVAAGRRLEAMLELGASRPWPETLEVLTGSRKMEASGILDYYAPLKAWLDVQNEGQPVGW